MTREDFIFRLVIAHPTLADRHSSINSIADSVDEIAPFSSAGAGTTIVKLRSALQWCAGADDFQEGGKAREGWLRLCAPLL